MSRLVFHRGEGHPVGLDRLQDRREPLTRFGQVRRQAACDGAEQGRYTGDGAAAEGRGRDGPEPPSDQGEPVGRCWGALILEAARALQPLADNGLLVRPIVVHHELFPQGLGTARVICCRSRRYARCRGCGGAA